eukprot:TRINITY_DN10768_c0_g1_i1.p1 TRINITY_DN10768_c0_g1~~TRINITY_DN10768_c0_g1_i1.p1  ORF type:complete len:431 (+),score=144.54 TRINITY_DN10768_c0_g1_i1:36-1295(+)
MATYINYGEGEEDATVQAAEWLQHLLQMAQGPDAEKAFTEKFKALNAEQENNKVYDYGPIFDFFVDYSKGLFDFIPENRPEERLKDLESFFAVIMSMLLLLEDKDHLDQATTRLCELFSESSEQQPELRLRLLMMLYNTFNNPTFELRYRVFKHTVDYAAKAEMFDQILPYLDYLDAWMADWDSYLTIDDKRNLYADLSKYMRNFGKKVDAFLYLKMFHSSFQGESAEKLNKKEVADATVELIKDAIVLPSVIQFDDILALDTVSALRKTKQEGLVQLCEVFLSGTVDDLKEFQKKNSKLFDEHGLNYQEVMSKIRLLTLATMAQGQSELSLDDIAKRLEESPTNVEPWVVRAISEGVVDGRIDQLNRKVLVKSSFQRKFEKNEWAFLDGKLTQWIDNLEHVIKFLGEQKKQVPEAVVA